MNQSEKAQEEDLFQFLHKTMEQVESALDSPSRINSVKRTLERPVPPLVHVLIRTLAADLDVPFAAATVLDEELQHFLSSSEEVAACDRDNSKCQFVIGSGDMVAINNVKGHSFWRKTKDALISNKPLQAYLGVPLKDADGEILGAVCVVDTKPRVWTAEEHYALYECSTLITRLLSTEIV